MGDDEAAARREQRRKEREAKRKERENEGAKEDTRTRRRRKEEEEEEVDHGQVNNREEEPEPERETIFETMSPQKKASILEGLAEEFRRVVEQREAKGEMVAVSAQELDELDLKVRSLRTQVRKAEEVNNQLGKQRREIEEKLTKNENELNKLRNELQSAEAENELAIKDGKKVAPKLPSTKAKKKASPWGGFVNVVRKAQSAAWEDKFKAMKAKQKGSEPKPDWVTKVKKPENPLIAMKKPASAAVKTEEKKPQWAQNKLLKKGAGGGARARAGADDESGAGKPGWTARSLKKSEKKDADAEEASRVKRHDWKEGLKKSDK